MSEWAAPGGPSGEGETPRYGERAPEGWTPPAQDPANPHAPVPPYAPQQPGPQPGWTPPPKRGLIPLRPLTLGDVLTATFQAIRRNPRPTFGFALLYNVVVTVIVGGVTGVIAWTLLSRFDMAAVEDQETILDGSLLLFLITLLATSLLTGALMGLVQGVIALDIAREALGERPRLRQLLAAARGRYGALIGWTFLESLASILLVVLVVGVFVAFLPLGPLGAAIGVLVAMLVGAGCLVLFCWIGTKLLFVPTLLVVERRTIGSAMRRSWALTRGGFWRIFGISLLIYWIVSTAAQIITAPIQLVAGLLGGFLNPNGAAEVTSGVMIGALVVSYALNAVIQSVVIVAQAAVPTVLYLDMRMRKEGLDLELQHWIEEQAAGRAPADPYRRD